MKLIVELYHASEESLRVTKRLYTLWTSFVCLLFFKISHDVQAGNTQAFVEQYLRAIRLQQQTTAPVIAPRTNNGGVLPRDGTCLTFRHELSKKCNR